MKTAERGVGTLGRKSANINLTQTKENKRLILTNITDIMTGK